jgi:hypothetical protein
MRRPGCAPPFPQGAHDALTHPRSDGRRCLLLREARAVPDNSIITEFAFIPTPHKSSKDIRRSPRQRAPHSRTTEHATSTCRGSQSRDTPQYPSYGTTASHPSRLSRFFSTFSFIWLCYLRLLTRAGMSPFYSARTEGPQDERAS